MIIGRMLEPMGLAAGPVVPTREWRELYAALDCAVVGVADSVQGEEVKVAIVAEVAIQADEVVAFLVDKVPRHMLPRYVEFMAAIPKTETQKIQRFKLQYINQSVTDLKHKVH